MTKADEQTGRLSESLVRALPTNAAKEKLNTLVDSYKNQLSSPNKLKMKGGKSVHSKFANDANADRLSDESALKINTVLHKVYSTIPSHVLTSEPLSKALSSVKHINFKNFNDLLSSKLLLSSLNYQKLKSFDNFYSVNSARFKSLSDSQEGFLTEKLLEPIRGTLIDQESENRETSFLASSKNLLTSEEEYGAKIRESRKSRKLSQAKLALLAGISVLSIKKIEKGVGNPSLKTVLKINEVLNLKLAML